MSTTRVANQNQPAATAPPLPQQPTFSSPLPPVSRAPTQTFQPSSISSSRSSTSTTAPPAIPPLSQQTTFSSELKLSDCLKVLFGNAGHILIGISIGVVGTVLAQKANGLSQRSLALAEWTADKDFREECEKSKVFRAPSQDKVVIVPADTNML